MPRVKDNPSIGGHTYNLLNVMTKPFESCPFEWTDYIGDVKVAQIEGKGRGVIAKKDLPPGTLICACRAFEIVFLEGNVDTMSKESEQALEESYNFSGEDDDPTLKLLARKVYDKLAKFPEKRAGIYNHHGGKQLGHLEPTEITPDLDMARIYGICKTNAFANAGDSYPETEKSVGLWSFPAFINHLCVGGNAAWKVFGDFFFVRTIRQIEIGQEILFSYVSPSYPFEVRAELLETRLGFVCTCDLCDLDRNLPEAIKQEKIKLRRLVQNQQVNLSKSTASPEASILLLEKIVEKLTNIQPDHGLFNSSLIDPLQKLGLQYFGVGALEKMVVVMGKACKIMETCCLPSSIIDCALWNVAGYLQIGNIQEAKNWGKIVAENLNLACGDSNVLQIIGPWAVEPLRAWELIE